MKITDVIERVKFHIDRNVFTEYKLKIKQSSKRVFLFGTIEHMNYGDIAINIAEFEFLNKYFPTYQIIEIPERYINGVLEEVKANINETDFVCFHGGGNMGDVWSDQEPMRRAVLTAFKNNSLISFPQSTNYTDFTKEGNLFKDNEVMSSDKNLTIFAREKVSYDIMESQFPSNVNIFLVPDIVLSMNKKIKNTHPKTDITTFFRRDREKESNADALRLLRYCQSNYIVLESDTVDDVVKVVNSKTRNRLLNNKLQEFRNSKLIITDRLHGMIFSVITGTPAIVFDNNNHKIRNSYSSWLKNVPYIYFADNMTEIQQKKIIDEVIMRSESHKIKLPDFNERFRQMASVIKNNI